MKPVAPAIAIEGGVGEPCCIGESYPGRALAKQARRFGASRRGVPSRSHATHSQSQLLGPRHPPQAARPRLLLPRGGRRADHRRGDPGADPRPGDPARMDGRLDLYRPARPHPGDGDRRRRPQAVPLPRRLARAPRSRQVRGDGGLREAAAEAPRPDPRGARHAGPEPGPRLRLRGRAARPRPVPGRQRALRERERQLRADDAQVPASEAREGDGAVRLPVEVRAAGPPPDLGARGDADAEGAEEARQARREPVRLPRGAGVARPHGRSRQRLDQGRRRSRLQRQGLPDLERDRALRRPPRDPLRGGAEEQGGAQADRQPRGAGDGGVPQQHAGGLPRLLHRSRASSTASTPARPCGPPCSGSSAAPTRASSPTASRSRRRSSTCSRTTATP